MATGRVVVTGAGGYVGGRLVDHLAGRGTDVVAVAHRSGAVVPEGVEVVVADLTEDGPWAAVVSSADAVVHLAAPSEVVAAREPDRAGAVTLATARRVAAAVADGGGRMVLVSTVHVYGSGLDGLTVDVDRRPEPRHPYAVSRLAAEHLAAGSIGGADLVVMRLSNSVGAPLHPGVDRWTLLVPDLCRQVATEGRVVLRSHGLQWRDWVPLTDVCTALAGAAAGRVPPGRHHLASGQPVTVRAVAELVADAAEAVTGERPPVEAPDPPAERPAAHRFDVTSLRAAGVASTSPLSAAVAETLEFCLRHRDELAA